MQQDVDNNEVSVSRMLLVAASAVIVIAGLRAVESLVLPILFAAILSVLAIPGVRLLRRARLPEVLAITIVVVSFIVPLFGIGAVIANSISGLDEAIPRYTARYQSLVESVTQLLERLPERFRPDPSQFEYGSVIRTVLEWVSASLSSVVVMLGNTVVVGLVLTFILLEAGTFPHKLELAFGSGGPLRAAEEASRKVARYLMVKTAFSATTGLLCWGLCSILGVELAGLWGLLAFMLNYIPNVGSFIAAIPPLLLALVGPTWVTAIWVATGYGAINFVLGNLLEPRFMGRSLGLSPLVVVLSLLFWTWMWGPAGALLSGPLTVILKLSLESSRETRWLAVLLGPGHEAMAAVTAAAIAPVSGPEP